MTILTPLAADAVPEAARPYLEQAGRKFGFVPNLLSVLAESPATLNGYLTLSGILAQGTFSAAEQQLILITASTVNGCSYCVAAHTMGAKGAGLAEDAIEAVRAGTPIADPRLAALHDFTVRVVEKRGWLAADEVDAFLDAGFTKAQVLEVLLAVALKTISNYSNHLAETPLDAGFEPARWEATRAPAA